MEMSSVINMSHPRVKRIAAAKVAGERITAVAKRERISRQYASLIANSDDCTQIMAGLVAADSARIATLWDKALRALLDGLTAKSPGIFCKQLRAKKGKDAVPTERQLVLYSPPDHYARLAAARRVIDLLTLGRPRSVAQPQQPADGMTLEEIEEHTK